MIKSKSIGPLSAWTEILFGLRLRTQLLNGLVCFETAFGRTYFLMKIGPDPLSRMILNLLAICLENAMFAYPSSLHYNIAKRFLFDLSLDLYPRSLENYHGLEMLVC